MKLEGGRAGEQRCRRMSRSGPPSPIETLFFSHRARSCGIVIQIRHSRGLFRGARAPQWDPVSRSRVSDLPVTLFRVRVAVSLCLLGLIQSTRSTPRCRHCVFPRLDARRPLMVFGFHIFVGAEGYVCPCCGVAGD